MLFQALRESVKSRGILIPYPTDLTSYLRPNRDYYTSLYQYNEEQKKQFEEKGTVSGIKLVTTDRLYFDFDSTSIELADARKDAIALASDLINNFAFPQETVQAYFSGRKGFALEVKLDFRITPEQFKYIISTLSPKYSTLDTVVSDPNRIIRVVNTEHPDSHLYKVPMELWELDELPIEEIRKIAQTPRKLAIQPKVLDKLPEALIFKPQIVLAKVVPAAVELDFGKKPKFLTNCRWALQNGYFKEGSRSTAFLCLASTYKNLGFDIEHVYRMLKGVAELQSQRENCSRFSDGEIYNNIVTQVFSETWTNGQYSCKQDGNWLKTYCSGLGTNSCTHSKTVFEEPHTLIEVVPSFKEYVKNIDKNIILTGIPSIDKNVFISTGANVGIIGAAGGGKSAIALDILNNTSKAGVKSVFASLDMHRNRMFEKIMYKLSSMKREDLYKVFAENRESELVEKLKQEFGNVFFFNKSSPSVADVRDYVLDCQEKSGEKIKLVMLDYFERVSSDFSDDTQASKRVAGELQDLVNDLDIALITLVQPNKNALSGGADQPIYDYTKIKGSSFVYQAFRIILSLWRPFYNPKDFSKDKFMQMAVLKNDLGELNEFAFKWEGKTGNIGELEDSEYDDLQSMLKEKEDKKNGVKNDGWN